MSDRPLLITVIGSLTMLSAILFLIFGVIFTILPESAIQDMWNDYNGTDVTYDVFKVVFSVVGVTLIVIAIISFLIGFAFLRGWTIAWYLGVLIYIVEAVLSLISIMTIISVITLAFSLIVLYYLFRPRVKEFFGV